MAVETNTVDPFDFSGGALCLDFANTIGDRGRPEKDRLREPGDLMRWSVEAGTVTRATADRLDRGVKSGDSAFRRAIHFRETLFRIFAGLAHDKRPAAEDMIEMNRELGAALRHLQIGSGENGFDWLWSEQPTRIEHLLWPIARSAAELLTSSERPHVRECASDRCTWLFIDRSRTHRRRWCDMKVCGNRAKARRHYERSRATSAGPARTTRRNPD